MHHTWSCLLQPDTPGDVRASAETIQILFSSISDAYAVFTRVWPHCRQTRILLGVCGRVPRLTSKDSYVPQCSSSSPLFFSSPEHSGPHIHSWVKVQIRTVVDIFRPLSSVAMLLRGNQPGLLDSQAGQSMQAKKTLLNMLSFSLGSQKSYKILKLPQNQSICNSWSTQKVWSPSFEFLLGKKGDKSGFFGHSICKVNDS